MVYINLKDTAPVLFFPRNGYSVSAEGISIVLTNTTDGNEVEVPIAGLSLAGPMARVVLDGVPGGLYCGEWQYRLSENGRKVATGLIVVFDGERLGPVEYSSEISVIQYGE